MLQSRAAFALGTLLWVSVSAACGNDSDAAATVATSPDAGPLVPPPVAGNGAVIAGSPASTVPASPSGAVTTPAGGSQAPFAGTSAAAGNGGAGGMGGMTSTAPANAGTGGQAQPAADSGALPPAPTPAPVKWSACGQYECAKLDVPLDYADPNGEKISLALKRKAARGAQKIGSLLINPGGPGGSAVDFLAGFAGGPGAALNARFDIVAFDPRGVGQSTPLNCHSTLEKLISADPTPDDDAEWRSIDADAKAFADECEMKYPKLLPHMGTRDVARDMDQVRIAVGDEKLSYFGYSYGTELGAVYAGLFPEKVRALVLDGALDLKLTALEVALEQADGFERALATFFDWCGEAASNCRWAQGEKPVDAYGKLEKTIEATPLSISGRKVGAGEFVLGVIAPLYSGVEGYRALSTALSAAASGDGSALLSFVDSYTERKRDGSYGNIQEANNAVNCIDMPGPSYDELRKHEMEFEAASPTFGISTLTGLLVCAHWPVQATKPELLPGAGAPPILVIGTTGDPATPYKWAQALADELESGHLLTYEGEGHTAYGRSVPCIDNAVNAYLIDGKLPAEGTRCSGGGGASAAMISADVIRRVR